MATRSEALIQTVGIDGHKRIEAALKQLGAAGERAFKRLERSVGRVGPAAERSTRRLTTMQRRLDTMNNRMGNMTRTLRTFAGAWVAAFSVRAIARASDEFTQMNNQIEFATENAEEFTKVMDGVRKMSNETGTDMKDNSETFVRFNAMMQELGKSNEETINMIGTLNKAFQLNGTSADEAASALRQLSQAFGRGELKGDEFVSMMENNTAMARALAEVMGVSIGQLQEMSTSGELTAERLFEAAQKLEEQVGGAYEGMTKTIEQSMTVLNNQWREFIGNSNEATGAARVISGAILLLANNLDIAAIAAGLFFGVLIAGKTIAGIVMLAQQMRKLVGVVRALNFAMLLNPLVLLAAAFAALGFAITAVILDINGMIDKNSKLGQAIDWVKQKWASFLQFIGEQFRPAFNALAEFFNDPFAKIMEGLGNAATWVLEKFGQLGGYIGEKFKNAFEAIGDWFKDTFFEIIENIGKLVDNVKEKFSEWLSSVIDWIKKTFPFVEKLINLFERLASAMGNSGQEPGGGGPGGQGAVARAGGGRVWGPGTSTSDSIPARLSRGEYVIKTRAVEKYGAALFDALNNMRLPRGYFEGFNVGGLVNPSPKQSYADGGAVSSSPYAVLNLTVGKESFEGLIAPKDTAERLIRYATKEDIKSGGRKTGWYK